MRACQKNQTKKIEFMLAANKFKTCYEAVTFDVDNTVLNRSGHKFIPEKAFERATQSFSKLIEYHHYQKKSQKRS